SVRPPRPRAWTKLSRRTWLLAAKPSSPPSRSATGSSACCERRSRRQRAKRSGGPHGNVDLGGEPGLYRIEGAAGDEGRPPRGRPERLDQGVLHAVVDDEHVRARIRGDVAAR